MQPGCPVSGSIDPETSSESMPAGRGIPSVADHLARLPGDDGQDPVSDAVQCRVSPNRRSLAIPAGKPGNAVEVRMVVGDDPSTDGLTSTKHPEMIARIQIETVARPTRVPKPIRIVQRPLQVPAGVHPEDRAGPRVDRAADDTAALLGPGSTRVRRQIAQPLPTRLSSTPVLV